MKFPGLVGMLDGIEHRHSAGVNDTGRPHAYGQHLRVPTELRHLRAAQRGTSPLGMSANEPVENIVKAPPNADVSSYVGATRYL